MCLWALLLLCGVAATAPSSESSECDCYVQMTLRDKPGLGHRVSLFVIGAAIARRAQCHYVVEADRFFGTRGLHGSFEWAPRFFALNASVASLLHAAPRHLATVASHFPALLQSRVCDAVMLLDDFSCAGLKDGWCGQMAGLFAQCLHAESALWPQAGAGQYMGRVQTGQCQQAAGTHEFQQVATRAAQRHTVATP